MKKFLSVLAPSLIFLILLSSSSPAKVPGGVGALWGMVKDSSSKSPLYSAVITLTNQSDSAFIDGAIADERGVFVLKELPYGAYNLKCTFMGYRTVNLNNIKITPESPAIPVGEISLMPSAELLDEVTVTGEKELVTYKIDKKVVNVEQSIHAKGGSAADVLESVPSVRVDVEGNVTLRGSSNFTLLVDGKPTIMDAKEYLKQVPADAIENIEIITNPSAKYDPEGIAGIINLVMKKEDLIGMNGLLSATAGTRDKYNGSAQLNFKNSKMNLFTSADWNDSRYHPYSAFTRETYSTDTVNYVFSGMDRMFDSKSYTFRLGADYNTSENGSFTLTGAYGYYGFDRIFPSNYKEWSAPGELPKYYYSTDDFLVGGNYYTISSNYFHKYSSDGTHNITGSLMYSQWNGEVEQASGKYNSVPDFSTTGGLLNRDSIYNDIKRKNYELKLDYIFPFSQTGKFETGVKSEALWKPFYYLVNNYDLELKKWNVNNDYTNKSDYLQTIQSVYATYSEEFFGMQFMLGLRGEYYYRNLDQITMNQEYDFEQVNFFPSFHATKQFEGENSLQFSYSRRVQRPDDRTLNPFPDFNDDYYISKGNPHLKPEFTNSFELNYRKGFGASFLSLETYYRQTNDLIARTLSLTDDNKILISAQNVNKDYLFGGEISANVVVAPWFRFNAGANYYNYHLVEMASGKETERSSNILDGNIAATFIFSQSTFLQANGHYSGDRITADGEMKSAFVAGFTLRQDLFDRALTIVLNARDPFKMAKYEMTSGGLNFKSYGYFMSESQTVTLTLSYRINNFERRPRNGGGQEVNIDFQGGGI